MPQQVSSGKVYTGTPLATLLMPLWGWELRAGLLREEQIKLIREFIKKPAETRDRIVQLTGDVPRVELFARQKTPGWDTWGNELENDLELAA